jgi:hypothetical protein
MEYLMCSKRGRRCGYIREHPKLAVSVEVNVRNHLADLDNVISNGLGFDTGERSNTIVSVIARAFGGTGF